MRPEKALPDNKSHNINSKSEPGPRSSINLQTRHKLALSFCLLLILVTSAFWLLSQNELKRSLVEYSDALGTTLAEQTATSIRELVLVNDVLALNVALTQIVRDDSILHASIYDVDGNTLSSAGQDPTRSAAGMTYSANITVQDTIAGSVQLTLDTSAIARYQARLRNLFLGILVLAIVLTVATAFALSGALSTPLLRMINRLEEYTDASDTTDEPALLDEAARLEQAIEKVMLEFEKMQGQLLKTGVWEKPDSLQDDEPARVAASILIIKVVNINTAIELLHPATLTNLLREYIFYLNQAIRLYGGEIYRLNGDSVMVCFNSNTCEDQHSINALYCAGLFNTLMGKINARHKEKDGQILEFRMAIHSGDVFLAPGLNNTTADETTTGGSSSILGKTTDIAYFLSKQSAPNKLIISEFACSQAQESEHFEISGQHEISMPADNVSFMAYILDNDFAANMDNIQAQCAHILGAH